MTSFEKYLDYVSTVKRYSARTVEIYAGVLERFTSFCAESWPGKDPVDMLNQPVIRSYEVSLMDSGTMSAKTVGLHLSVLSGCCRFLMKEGRMKSNPVHLVKRPKVEKRLPEFYRDEAVSEYFDSTCGDAEYGNYAQQLSRVIISILFNTGLRRSELISLKRSSIDMGRRVLRVRGKGNKMREIPLIPSLCEEIALYLQSAEKVAGGVSGPDTPLLLTPKGGPLYPVYIDRVVKKELSQVDGITGRKSPHVLRHTLATELLGGGTDLNSIKELLGHSSLAATQVYTHNSIEMLKSVYNNAHPRAKNGGKNGDKD